MRRFTVCGRTENSNAWLESGFAAFAAGKDADGRPLRPDVLLVAAGEWGLVGELWPRVAVVAGAAGPPAELGEDYKAFAWPGGTVLTRLEAPLAAPDREAYGDAARAVACAIYAHLLADVFRDTREWCGHTFSVLGR